MSKKESYWFSHDCNARTDAKIIAMMQQYGMVGYGRWWILLERLRAEDEYQYAVNKKFAYNVLAQDMMCSIEEAKEFVQDCVAEFELLETDDAYIWAPGLNARMKPLEEKRRMMSERGKKGAAVTNAKRAAQAQQNNDTSEDVPQQNAPKKRKTEQNIEKKNRAEESKTEHTKQNKHAKKQTPPPSAGAVIISLDSNHISHPHDRRTEQLKQKALADDGRFVQPYTNTGKLTKPQLEKWLTAFNKHLSFIGDEVKTEKDYRTHFAAWFKYRDPATEKPEDFSPVPKQQNKAAVVVPVAKFMKTPEMLVEERRQQNLRWMNKAKVKS